MSGLTEVNTSKEAASSCNIYDEHVAYIIVHKTSLSLKLGPKPTKRQDSNGSFQSTTNRIPILFYFSLPSWFLQLF